MQKAKLQRTRLHFVGHVKCGTKLKGHFPVCSYSFQGDFELTRGKFNFFRLPFRVIKGLYYYILSTVSTQCDYGMKISPKLSKKFPIHNTFQIRSHRSVVTDKYIHRDLTLTLKKGSVWKVKLKKIANL